MKVAVLGASPKPDRYANKAIRLLLEHGHDVVPVNPRYETIAGLPVVASLSDLEPGSVDTVTVYLGPAQLLSEQATLLQLQPRRVIFNPGAEEGSVEESLRANGVDVQRACTLVLLNTGQF